MGFLPAFDPSSETPSMLAARRVRANAVAQRLGWGAPSIGQGIGDIFRGLGAGFANYRADQAEQAGNAYADGPLHSQALAAILDKQPQVGMTPPPSNDAVGAAIKSGISTGQTPQLAVYTPPKAGQGPDAGLVQPNRMQSAAMAYPGGDGITTADQGGVFAPNTANGPIDQTQAQAVLPPMPASDTSQAPAPMVPASNDAAHIPDIMKILNNPWLHASDRAILEKRLETIQQQADPAYQQKMQLGDIQLQQAKQTLSDAQAPDLKTYSDPVSGNLYSYDTADPKGTMTLVRKADPASPNSPLTLYTDKNSGNAYAYDPRDPKGTMTIVHKSDPSSPDSSANDPSKILEYKFYAKQEKDGGREPMTYEQFTARSSGIGGVSKDDVTSVSQAIINGDQPPEIKGLYKGGMAVKAELERQGFNLSKANQEWQAANRFTASSQGPQQLRVRQNIDALAQSLPHLQELVDKYNAGPYPALNSAMMAADYQGLTNPEASSLVKLIRQQISDVQAQTAGVIMGSGSPTDAAFQLAHDQLQTNWSKRDITAALDNMKLNLQYRVNALNNAVPDNNRYVKAPVIAPDAPNSGTEEWIIDANGNPVRK